MSNRVQPDSLLLQLHEVCECPLCPRERERWAGQEAEREREERRGEVRSPHQGSFPSSSLKMVMAKREPVILNLPLKMLALSTSAILLDEEQTIL